MTAKQFVGLCCFNITRSNIYNVGLRNLCDFLAKNNISTVYIDGSFVTQKEWPSDIDCFFELTIKEYLRIFPYGHADWHNQLHKKYFCDAYHCITDFPSPIELQGKTWNSSREYWDSWFGHTEDGTPKGYISLGTADVLSEVAK